MKSFCDYYSRGICRSCTLMDVDYSTQLKIKEAVLLKSINLPESVLLPTQGSLPQRFRNKAKLVVTGNLERPIIGLEGEEKLDEGREILSCPLHHPRINELVAKLPAFIQKAKLVPYQIAEKKGELKGLILYHSQNSNQTYLRFILRSKESLDRIKKNLADLVDFHCVSANIQPIPHAILEGDEEIIMSESNHIDHYLNQIKMRLGPKGFVQTNQSVAEKLYETASNWVKELQIKKFAEIFSGQGAFSFFIAPSAEECIGFEIDPRAVEEANSTVKKLGYPHLRFTCSDAADVAQELSAFNPDLILVNPPRRGLGKSLDLFKNSFSYLIYSSCNVKSLESDLKELAPYYEIMKVQIFDMFPHTQHFETLVLLKGKNLPKLL